VTTDCIIQASPALPRGLSLEALAQRLYVAPAGVLSGNDARAAVSAGQGWSLAGGDLSFGLCRVSLRDSGRVIEAVTPFAELVDWSEAEGPELARHVGGIVKRLGRRRAPFAGLEMDRPHVMGIVNVTPDSFSDGGKFFDPAIAIAHGKALLEAGATILDVGGESTRPGSLEVDPQEELRRVLPVISGLAALGAVVSVDTRHAEVMEPAVAAGAKIINDINGLCAPGALEAAARSGAAVVVMHMQGDPQSMQQDPRYGYAPLDVFDHLVQRVAACRAAGIPDEKICVDPGVGFGKTVEHNLQVMAQLGLYHGFGLPVLLGVSRKSFIGKLSRGEPASDRLGGSLTAALAGLEAGMQILRVHDVAETVQALAVWRGLRQI